MRAPLRKLTKSALDLLFPLQCLGCHQGGRLLCPTCVATLPRLMPPYCSVCGQPATDRLCRRCAVMPLEVNGLRAPFLMEGLIREAIHDFKYRNVRAAAPELAQLLADYLASNPMLGEIIVPVPMHSSDLRGRGYNQSALLARELSKLTGLPVNERLLARIRKTARQVDLPRQERLRNVAGSFASTGDATGQAILLVDDVATTGSTMSACAAALRAAGAVSVWGLALAREAQSHGNR